MRKAIYLAGLLLAAPVVALAQTSYSHASITGPAAYPSQPYYVPQSTVCSDLHVRKAVLDDEKVTYDHELQMLNVDSAELARDLRALDSSDAIAVADYNARSDAHNRAVAEHNRSVASMNDAAAQLNTDLADYGGTCAWR